MQVKKYRVNNMEQAYNAARRDLGSDAVMIDQRKGIRKGPFGFLRKRVLEVTFIYDPAATPSSVKKYPALDLTPTQWPPLNSEENSQVIINEQFEKRLDSFENMMKEFMDKFDIVKRDITYDYPDDIQVLLSKMIDEQVREELAHSLAKQTEKLMRSKPGAAASEILEHLLQEQFGRAEPIVHKKFTQKVVLILGPTGVGKTTTLIKLAADFKVRQMKNVGIINTDCFRIGAQEQLETYAEILGTPIQRAYEPHQVEEAMEQLSDRDIIFVDTEGKRPGEEEYKENLLELIRILKPDDILLCLTATTSFASIKEMIDTYGFIDDYRLLITKLDETKYRGELLNISWYTSKPIAYVTTGQLVPDDIEIVDIEKLVKEIVNTKK